MNKPSGLKELVERYFLWMTAQGYSNRTISDHRCVLKYYQIFVFNQAWSFEKALKLRSRMAFLMESRLTKRSAAMKGFARYLEEEGLIEESEFIKKSEDLNPLPRIYEDYLKRVQKLRQMKEERIRYVRRKLNDFHDWLTKSHIRIEHLTIEQVDLFLKENTINLAPGTKAEHRGIIKKFLRYLYLERKILRRNLADLIVSAPVFNRENPPRFLRMNEIQKVLNTIDLSTNEGLRTNAMFRIAYTTGLRPGEIARLMLEDISFKNMELIVTERKGWNPDRFPLPEETIKAMAAYIMHARPEDAGRNLFVSLSPPYKPITGGLVSDAVGKAMKAAGVPGTAYWLRHTYAQNLLESGASIFEIKEMLGHDCIKATKRYLHIHIKLMREVLFGD